MGANIQWVTATRAEKILCDLYDGCTGIDRWRGGIFQGIAKWIYLSGRNGSIWIQQFRVSANISNANDSIKRIPQVMGYYDSTPMYFGRFSSRLKDQIINSLGYGSGIFAGRPGASFRIRLHNPYTLR